MKTNIWLLLGLFVFVWLPGRELVRQLAEHQTMPTPLLVTSGVAWAGFAGIVMSIVVAAWAARRGNKWGYKWLGYWAGNRGGNRK